MDRREIMKRRLAIDAYWGLGSAALGRGCHEVEPIVMDTVQFEPSPGEPSYLIEADSEGNITFLPGSEETENK